MKERIVLVGPCGPPDGGTTIPFGLAVEYIKSQCAEDYDIKIVNSTTGDKSSGDLLKPSMLFRIAEFIFILLCSCLLRKKIIIFGSQRFITVIGSLVILIFKPFGKRVYLRVNGGGYDQFYAAASSGWRFVIERVMSKANAVVVQTEIVANVMRQVWSNIYVVSNYRPLLDYDHSKRIFDSESVAFIYTGLVRKLKGCEELLEAFVLVKDRLKYNGYKTSSVTLELYGEPILSEKERINIEKYRHVEGLFFRGPVPNRILQEKYLDADVFVFPTYWPTEGHSGSVLEAMMSGLPLIVTDWRSMAEIVDEKSGLFCPVKDIDALAQCMYKSVIDIQLRKDLSVAARICSERFETSKVCKQFLAAFELKSVQ